MTTFTIVIVEPDGCAQKHTSSRRALRSKERSDKYFARRIAQGGCESAPTGSQPTKLTTYRDVASNSQPKFASIDFGVRSDSKVTPLTRHDVLSTDTASSGGRSPSDAESNEIGRDAAVAHSSDPEDDCDAISLRQQVNSDQTEAPNVVEQVAIVVGASQHSNQPNHGSKVANSSRSSTAVPMVNSPTYAAPLTSKSKPASDSSLIAPPLASLQELKSSVQTVAPSRLPEQWTKVGRGGRPVKVKATHVLSPAPALQQLDDGYKDTVHVIDIDGFCYGWQDDHTDVFYSDECPSDILALLHKARFTSHQHSDCRAWYQHWFPRTR